MVRSASFSVSRGETWALGGGSHHIRATLHSGHEVPTNLHQYQVIQMESVLVRCLKYSHQHMRVGDVAVTLSTFSSRHG